VEGVFDKAFTQQTFHIGPMSGRCRFQYRADIGFYIGPTSACNTARHRPDIGYIYLASILPT
jgi:hypothetical protein